MAPKSSCSAPGKACAGMGAGVPQPSAPSPPTLQHPPSARGPQVAHSCWALQGTGEVVPSVPGYRAGLPRRLEGLVPDFPGVAGGPTLNSLNVSVR